MYLSNTFYNLNVNNSMIIKMEYINTEHTRKSKCGHIHVYTRRKEIITLLCDNCGEIFNRNRGSMDPNRLNNNVYHVCNNCDIKRFAQSKGVENKNFWNLPASIIKTIDQL